MGVLGRDPKTKYFPNGGSIILFSIATIEYWKNQPTSEHKQATEWHRIITSNRLADFASLKYLKKGGGLYRGFIAYPKLERLKRIRKGNNRDSSRCAAIALVNSLLSWGFFNVDKTKLNRHDIDNVSIGYTLFTGPIAKPNHKLAITSYLQSLFLS